MFSTGHMFILAVILSIIILALAQAGVNTKPYLGSYPELVGH